VNDKLARMRHKVHEAYFVGLLQNFPGGTV